jgi:hypothetical protein
MIKTPLCDLCVKYGTDKVIWGYTPHYYSELVEDREAVRAVLEVGICGFRDIPNNVVGASLFVWRDFFPNAVICGIDNDGRFVFNDQDRIHTFQADAYNTRQLNDALDFFAHHGVDEFDFIVDDAVHDPLPQVALLNSLMPRLSDKGLYAMEDVCPYKLPEGNLDLMLSAFPTGTETHVIATHKDERLLLTRWV